MIKGLPDRLKKLRVQHKYSQKGVADKLKVSPAIISAYETGERTPSTENILALSRLYRFQQIIFLVIRFIVKRYLVLMVFQMSSYKLFK